MQGYMLLRTLPAGFIAPCLPTKTTTLPSANQWLHEIKHDGFRIIARKEDEDSRASDTRDTRSFASVGNAVLAPRAEQTNEGIADANVAASALFCGAGASVGGESAPGSGRLK